MSMHTAEAYTRRKMALINAREGTSHGEEYYEILYKEVAAQFQYSEQTLKEMERRMRA